MSNSQRHPPAAGTTEPFGQLTDCDLWQVTPALQACFPHLSPVGCVRARAVSPGTWLAVVTVTAQFITVIGGS